MTEGKYTVIWTTEIAARTATDAAHEALQRMLDQTYEEGVHFTVTDPRGQTYNVGIGGDWS